MVLIFYREDHFSVCLSVRTLNFEAWRPVELGAEDCCLALHLGGVAVRLAAVKLHALRTSREA